MVKPAGFPISFLFLFLLIWFRFNIVGSETAANPSNGISETNSMVHVGVVLDLNSTEGVMYNVCISMALSDFYATHPNYQTRLFLHTRNSEDVVGAAFGVLDLLKNVEVHAIIGPQRTAEATFAIELGEKAHVPIISCSATSPSLSRTQSPYFIRTSLNDSAQVKAITAIVQGFGWHELVFIYEDTEYGNGIVPHLTDALLEENIHVSYKYAIPTSATDTQILNELNMLVTMQTKVFLVHMTSSLGSRLFPLVDEVGMMTEGYAWLITHELSNGLNVMDPVVFESMEGVLGIRPYIPKSKGLDTFKTRWKRKYSLVKPSNAPSELSVYGLWAFDTTWALAMAIERIGLIKPKFLFNTSKTATDIGYLGVSEFGPRLLKEISNTKFHGLSGEFHMVNGHLQPSAFEIFNVIGKGQRIIGYWSPDKGIYSTSTKSLKKIIWPGDSTQTPKSSAILMGGKPLRIGVPKKQGFAEFVDVHTTPNSTKIKFTGFSIDVLCAVVKALPFPIKYEFEAFMDENGESAGTYDDLLHQLQKKKFDAVVGDITIVANRAEYVEFTLPYTESGVTMLVPIIHDKHHVNMLIFLQPFSKGLWYTLIASFIYVVGSVLFIERRNENTETNANPRRSIAEGVVNIFLLPQNESVSNLYSKFLLAVWFSEVIIIGQIYTAILTSMLTADQLQPSFVSVNDLRTKDYYVGYQNDSFIKDLLVNKLNFNESYLKPYSTVEEYHVALTKGSQNGGVAAIFDEIPYIKLFLKKFGTNYMMAGPTYRTDGIGFAFPLDSRLVHHFSRAILKVTEGEEMNKIEHQYFGHDTAGTKDEATTTSPSGQIEVSSLEGLIAVVFFTGLLGLGSKINIFQKLLQRKRLIFGPKEIRQDAPSVKEEVRQNALGVNEEEEVRNLQIQETLDGGEGTSEEANPKHCGKEVELQQMHSVKHVSTQDRDIQNIVN